MARMPYTNFHDINLDWIIKRVMKAFTPDNPPDYPVKSVNSKTGHVVLDSDDIQDIDSGLDLTDAMRKKQNRPESTGTAGQVLGLDNQLQPVWLNQPAPGVTAYDDLTGRPKINNVTLSGELDGTDLGLLDAPASAGSLGQVLTSDGQGGQTWQTLPTPPQPLAGDYAPVIMDSASGPVASFPDGAAGLDMESLVAEIVPIQTGAGDPSPNNIRPITGRGGVTVYHTGENLLKLTNTDSPIAVTNGTIDITENSIIKRTQTNSVSVTTLITTSLIEQINNSYYAPGTYYFNYEILTSAFNTVKVRPEFIYDDGTIIDPGFDNPCTLTQKAKLNRIYITTTTLSANSEFSARIWLTVGNTAKPYKPFGNFEPILEAWGDIAGTVYGGTIDIISGVLTVKYGIVDLGSLNYVYESTPAFFRSTTGIPNMKQWSSYYHALDWYCDFYKIGTTNSSPQNDYEITATINSSYPRIKDSGFTDPDLFKTHVTGHKLVFELNTPTIYQLTAQQVQTILGQNNIYSDSGDCSVTYRADTKLFILKVIA